MTHEAAASRRRLLVAAAAGLAAAAAPHVAWPHRRLGPITPREAAPPVALTLTDGRKIALHDLLAGRVTAMQLMFTGCSATCPIQGAIFAELQNALAGDDGRLRLLSLSIDPLGDDRRALETWLDRFAARPERWRAALPASGDLDRLLDFLRGRAGGADRHTTHVHLFDTRARLAYRTIEMPAGRDVATLMRQLAAMG